MTGRPHPAVGRDLDGDPAEDLVVGRPALAIEGLDGPVGLHPHGAVRGDLEVADIHRFLGTPAVALAADWHELVLAEEPDTTVVPGHDVGVSAEDEVSYPVVDDPVDSRLDFRDGQSDAGQDVGTHRCRRCLGRLAGGLRGRWG
ncbi:MAG: hypothetical protein PVH07_06960 [Chloroflexota bacterium]